jgi:hypothetical protein
MNSSTNKEPSLGFSPEPRDRRLRLERRVADGDVPPERAEQRVLPERRGLVVEEFHVDEWITLGAGRLPAAPQQGQGAIQTGADRAP